MKRRTNTKARCKQFCAERDAVLRSLDRDRFIAHCEKWKVPQPKEGWLPMAPEILMHKARLELRGFTAEERAASIDWLLSHGCELPRGATS